MIYRFQKGAVRRLNGRYRSGDRVWRVQSRRESDEKAGDLLRLVDLTILAIAIAIM